MADWEQTVRAAAATASARGEAVVLRDVAGREHVERVVREWLEAWGWDPASSDIRDSEAGVMLSKGFEV